MALKSWIDEIKTDESGPKSEAQLDKLSVPVESFPGENRADEILFSARDRIMESGVFYGTPETWAAEDDVDRTYKAIINGGCDFTALNLACERWVQAARTKPASPETISLFSGSGK